MLTPTTNTLLTVMAYLAVLAPAPAEARLGNPLTSLKQRAAAHAGSAADLDMLRRASSVQKREGNVSNSGAVHVQKKKKRRVMKRKSSCIVQNPVEYNNATVTGHIPSATATATATAIATSTSTSGGPGNNWIASESVTSVQTSAAASSTPVTPPTSSSNWKMVDKWSGNSFFDNFNFWSWNDPTHGTVDYVDAGTAWNEGLISINEKGNAIMKVDTTQNVWPGRKSVRIHGNLIYTGGMVVMDALHMPEGCGTWPAWWSNGPNWPYGGEIDILEGVNAFSQNQISLHTGPGCTMPQGGMSQSGTLLTGGYDANDCSSANTNNQGCGVRDLTTGNSYGAPYNAIGGGVYAVKWDKSGINVWWFPRYAIPSDITNESPEPSGWGTPVANFPSDNCDPYKFFYEHFNIFDTTFCGDWAGADGIWKYAGYAGQDQSCAAITGYDSCSDYVLNNGNAFHNAYWEIAHVTYYNSTVDV